MGSIHSTQIKMHLSINGFFLLIYSQILIKSLLVKALVPLKSSLWPRTVLFPIYHVQISTDTRRNPDKVLTFKQIFTHKSPQIRYFQPGFAMFTVILVQ